MKKIISDKGFEKYMDGEMDDLHPDISHLVYAAYSSRAISTSWSWAGTVGKIVDGHCTNHPELVTYEKGILIFSQNIDHSSSNQVIDQILSISKSKPYAKISESDGKYMLVLEMEDLIVEKEKQRGVLGIREIPLISEVHGIARYSSFMDTWNGIYEILKPHVVNPELKTNLETIERDVLSHSANYYPRRIFCDSTKCQFQ
jgi:hypothetical protein